MFSKTLPIRRPSLHTNEARVSCQRPLCTRPLRVMRASSGTDAVVAPVATPAESLVLFKALDDAYEALRKSPPSMRLDYSKDVLDAMTSLKAGGATTKWGVANLTGNLKRRNVYQNELRQVGIKAPDMIAVPSIRNDATFLFTVVVSTSLLAVVAGVVLPGDWGGFGSYLIGSISLVVLGIGSTAPGLLTFFIDKFSQVFPDYRDRVVRHEAGHFLLGYLTGIPVTGYSLELGREHTEFAEAKIQARIIEKTLTDDEVDSLALMAVAGIAAEGQQYEEIMGQTADLFDLQRLLLRSKTRLSDQQQQNITRWAVYSAASLLRTYKKEHAALIEAMSRGANVADCVRAIESAGAGQ